MSSGAGRFLRLKSAIDATLESTGDSSLAASALAVAYRDFRVEAHQIAEDTETVDEFLRLFPQPLPLAPTKRLGAGFDPVTAGTSAHEARALLARLSGWLDGFVQELRDGGT